MIESRSAADDVSWSTAGLDNESFGIQSFEDITNDLSDRLECRQIIFCLLIPRDETPHVFTHTFQTSFHLTMFTNLGAVLFQHLFPFALFLGELDRCCCCCVPIAVDDAVVIVVVIVVVWDSGGIRSATSKGISGSVRGHGVGQGLEFQISKDV
jgi:hypothetical protein